MANGALTPAHAAKLRGRLCFSHSLLFGRVGRALLNPFPGRQYSKAKGLSHPLNGDLKLAITRRTETLVNAEPRRTQLTHPKPFIVYFDAAGSGVIAFLEICDGAREAGRAHFPLRFANSSGIYEFELAISAYALDAAPLRWPGRPILLYAANSAAARAHPGT